MKRKIQNKKGFSLLVAIVVTSILVMIAFVVADLALKELILASAGQQSEIAFYMADSGMDCAIYWDVKNPNNPGISAFSTSTPDGVASVKCNNQTVSDNTETTIATGTFSCNGQNDTTGPNSIIGGPSSVQAGLCGISIFQINFGNSCAVIQVTKNPDGTTRIDSRGYNTCAANATRYERGITMTY